MFGFLKTCLYWLVSIAVGIFSVLFVVGMAVQWRDRSNGPQLRGFDAKDAEEKVRTYNYVMTFLFLRY